MKFKSRQLFLSALMAILFSAGSAYGQEIITGDYFINKESGSISTKSYVQIGNDTTVGSLTMTGGSLKSDGYVEVPKELMLRDDFKPGLDVVNGTLNISAGTVTTAEGIFARGTNGNTATINISGGTLTSTTYPVIGAEKGSTGIMNISGGTFISNKSFYCASDGVGYVNLSGTGKLTINNGLQIARDYGRNGGCEGYFTMSGGELYTKSYFIIAFDNAKDSTHVTKGIFDMSGGVANINSYFCLTANHTENVSAEMIYGEVNIRNNSEINIVGHLGISNGENNGTLVNAVGGTGLFSVFDTATVKVSGNTIIGNSLSSLNIYGGSFNAIGESSMLTNAGTVNVSGGDLNITANMTNIGNMNVSEGTIAVGIDGYVGDTKTGNLNISGTGAMTVGGSFTAGQAAAGVGNISVSGKGILTVTTQTDLASAGTANFTVTDDASVTLTGSVSNGPKGTMTLFGGKVLAKDNLVNKGTLSISGGDLNVTGTLTNTNTINILAGTTGIGKLTVGGDLDNRSTINVGVSNGLALFDGYDKSEGIIVGSVTGTKPQASGIKAGAVVSSVGFKDNNLIVKLTDPAISQIFDSTCGSFTLDTVAPSGWVSLGSFTGTDPYVFTLNVQPGTGKNIDDFISVLGGDLLASGNPAITASKAGNQVQINGLSAEDFSANVFAWNFTDAAYGEGAGLVGMKANQVPEPATWVMLILGIAGVGFYRKRNR